MNLRSNKTNQSLEFFRDLVEHVSDWIWQINEKWEFTYSNSAVSDILGYTPEEITGVSMFSFIKEDEKTYLQQFISESLKNKSPLTNLDFTMIHRDGHEVFIETNGNPIITHDEKSLGYRGIHRNISCWKANQEQKKQLLDIIEASPDFIGTADLEGNTTYLNPSAKKILGISEQPIDTNSDSYLISLWRNNNDLKIGADIAIEKGIWKGETVLKNSVGKKVPVSQIIVAHKSNQGDVHFLSTIARDISERKAHESIIKHQALYDTLTELPNRRYLDEKISQLIDGNNKTNTFALLFIDIDNFKEINDTYGHKYGDIALKLIASRIKRSIRENDFLCRFGGDEFILLVEGIKELNDLKGYANRLMKIFEHPFCMDTYSLSITCSIGISVYPDHGKDEDILLQKADKIMYQTKQQGKNGFLITNDDK